MSGPKGRIDSRVDLLERQVQQLLRQLGGQPSRYGHGAAPSQVRLIRTAPDSEGGAYPETGNTFPFVFADGDFTENPGTHTPTITDRQSEPATRYAHDLNNLYHEVAKPLFAVQHGRKFYIIGAGGVNIVVFTLDSPLATTDSSKFATPVRAILGPLPEDTIIVKNTEHIQEGEAGAIGYAIKNNENEWDILLVECPPETIEPQDEVALTDTQDTDTYTNPYLDGDGYYQQAPPPDSVYQQMPPLVDILI